MMFRPNTSAGLFDEIRADMFTALGQFGGEVVEVVRDKISVDVEYVEGPRGGTRVIRSVRGEPPRRESGDLYESYQAAVETDAEVVTLDVFSDLFYSAILELKLERPHLADTAEEMEEAFLDRVAAAFEGH